MKKKIAVCFVVFIRNETTFNIAIDTLCSLKEHKTTHDIDTFMWEVECKPEYRAYLKQFAKRYTIGNKNILARNWNRSIKFAFQNNYDYCMIPNMDIILERDMINNLVNFAENNQDALVYSPYAINHTYGKPNSTYLVKPEGHIDYDTYAYFMVRREFLRTKGFDENYVPAYAEDVDMGYRMKLLKEKHYCVREAMFQHIMAVTISNGGQDIFKQSQNNAIKYHIQKWGGLPRQEKFLTPFNKGGDINYWKK